MRATTSTFSDTMRAPLLNLLLITGVAGASLTQACISLAQAQTAAPEPQTAAISPDAIKQREKELRQRRKDQREREANAKAERAEKAEADYQLRQKVSDALRNRREFEDLMRHGYGR